MLFRSTAVENLSFISYFDLLGNDELANVLERLPVQDRMQAELINSVVQRGQRQKLGQLQTSSCQKTLNGCGKKLHNTDCLHAKARLSTTAPALATREFKWWTEKLADNSMSYYDLFIEFGYLSWIDATSFYQFKNMLKQLLTRCGPYVRNVDVTESSWLSRSLCDVLFMLPNVEQIKLCQLHIKNDRLPGYRRCLSDLRTLIADDFNHHFMNHPRSVFKR
ncbi:hypothetical protein DdX_18570 [Ditylenchus destructor]|uniref:Uncharacterized protein n=1 Tax=Ditylenchus destructor TaxID=166010 RepID=A0AAD4QXY8_9BILA|nr:hypothetical protein DdX_18570 [Ditylenchus destructor]